MGFPQMTLRDYFAAKAMQGLIEHTIKAPENDDDAAGAMELLPNLCYMMADAMLKAREQ